MRLLVLSDLHIEFWGESLPRINLSASRPDVVALAGDIDLGTKAVGWATRTFPGLPVLYVHGNHEAYGKKLEEMQEALAEACRSCGHIHFLNREEFRLGGIRFLGATLWTDFKLFGDETRAAAMREAEALMSDYRRIRLGRQGYRKLRAGDTAQINALDQSWLNQKLAEPWAGKTVVITHMAPSMQSIAARYGSELSSAAYASRLDGLAEKADIWIHGHTHSSFDYRIGKCRVVCNPCGYPESGGHAENPAFNPDFVIDIQDRP